jgi:hypothetical protein
MKSTTLFAALLMAFAGSVALLTTGCESTSTADEVITVTPSSATLVGKSTASFVASATSTNSPLVLPLEWNLDRGDLGRILSTVGLTAVYESNGKIGNNTISVQDQLGQAGVAVVNQVEAAVTNEAAAATSAEPITI